MTSPLPSVAAGCDVRRVRRRLRDLIASGVPVRASGRARSEPEAVVERYPPRCAVDLFGSTYFLSGYLYDEALGFFVGYFLPDAESGSRERALYPRIFYKDSSLLWRVASHYVHDAHEYWIGKGDTRVIQVDDEEFICSVEETTNLPFEVQAAFDDASRSAPRAWDDHAVEWLLRRAPSGRVEPYADFTAPRRADPTRINRGRRVAWFTRPGDPESLRFARGFEPDLKDGLVGVSASESQFFGGRMKKYRILSVNRHIQYMFFESPTHVWLNPPQALTQKLSPYGVRLVDVHADDDLFVPGFEYHEVDDQGEVVHSQIPDGYAGDPHPDDPHRSDASAWLEALPIVQAFRASRVRRG